MASWNDLNKKAGASAPAQSGGFSGWQQLNEEAKRPAYINELRRIGEVDMREAERAGKFSTIAKETVKGTFSIVPTFFKTLNSIYSETPGKITEDIKAGAKDIQEGKIIKGVAKAGLRTAGDAAIAIFAPISAAIGSVLEQGGGQKLVDKAGTVIADKSGITDIPAFQKFAVEHPNAAEDFERIITIATARFERGRISPKDIINETRTLINNVKKPPQPPVKVPVEGTTPETTIPIRTPKTKQAEYAERMGYEPYIPVEDLPVIRFQGSRATGDNLPTIQLEGRKSTSGDIVYEPVGSVRSFREANTRAAAEPTRNIFENATKEPTPTTLVRERGLGSSLRRDAILRGITDDLGDAPTYQTRSRTQSAQTALSFVEENPRLSYDIARGRVPAPEGLLTNEIYAALKEKAIQDADVVMLRRLGSDSEILSRATELGREIEAYKSLKPNDPIKAINEVAKARERRFTKDNPTKEANKELKKQTKKAKDSVEDTIAKQVTKKTWNDFIESIQC